MDKKENNLKKSPSVLPKLLLPVESKSSFKKLTRNQTKGFQSYQYSHLIPQNISDTERQRRELKNFIRNGPYTPNNYKIDKVAVFFSTFPKIVDENDTAPRADKIRRILLSPQLNLMIIFLIILDWVIAVIETVIEMFDNKSNFLMGFEFFSLGLLSVFIIEILLKILLIPGVFFRSKLELFDAFIVISSYSLEIMLITKQLEINEIGKVLTIFRYMF
jgi:hypothetical protein